MQSPNQKPSNLKLTPFEVEKTPINDRNTSLKLEKELYATDNLEYRA
jgi:hypothetical protein